MTTMDIHADINYFAARNDPIETSAWKPRHLGLRDEGTRTVKISDARGKEENFDLDVNGFKFVKLPPKSRSTESDAINQNEYYPEIEQVLKKL